MTILVASELSDAELRLLTGTDEVRPSGLRAQRSLHAAFCTTDRAACPGNVNVTPPASLSPRPKPNLEYVSC